MKSGLSPIGLGGFFREPGKGWFYRSDNVVTERDPTTLRRALLPADGRGLRVPAFDSIQEQDNVVPLDRDSGLLIESVRAETTHP